MLEDIKIPLLSLYREASPDLELFETLNVICFFSTGNLFKNSVLKAVELHKFFEWET